MRLIDADRFKNWIMDRYICFDHTLDDIDAQPTIVPERKKGRWVRIEDENGDFLCWECSECRERYVMPYHRASYCPNCGAEMVNSDEL